MSQATRQLIVAGIGTEVGKTLCSAILVQALKADYWKPVQAGDLDYSDTHKVKAWANHEEAIFYPEAHRLNHPMSPHAAADLDGVTLKAEDFALPTQDRNLVVELAGGLMVPLTHSYLNIDLIRDLGLPVVLVSRFYLGSINHSLLSVALLKAHNIPVLGWIFNDEVNQASREVILEYSGWPSLLDVPFLEETTPEIVQQYAAQLKLS